MERAEDVENGSNIGKNRGYPHLRLRENVISVEEPRYGGFVSWVVPLFVAANVGMFVAVMYVNNCPSESERCVAPFLRRLSFQPLRENPLLGPSSGTLEKLGALQWDKVVYQNQGWRLITCIWLHAGVIHLLTDMLSLVFIGIRLEQQFGFIRIAVIYLVSGFGGSILSSLFIRTSISVGASGALFGLLGAMLSELITNWSIYSNKVAAFTTLVVIILINLGVGLLPHVDNFAHIGGILSGFLLGFVILLLPPFVWTESHNTPPFNRIKYKFKPHQLVLCFVSLVLFIVGLTVGLVMLFKGRNLYDQCHWCHYLSCVPTSRWDCGN